MTKRGVEHLRDGYLGECGVGEVVLEGSVAVAQDIEVVDGAAVGLAESKSTR